jgi:uncharacterized protein (TIGR02145 family)
MSIKENQTMKKILLCAAFIAASFTGIAQVGVGTITPAGALDIVSTTSGLVLPRVANTSVVVNPNGGAIENGTMVYDLSANCVKFYANGAWTGCIQFAAVPPPPPTSQVSSAGGFYTFLSHNLGADTSLDPHTPVKGLNGDYYQWGKNAPDADVDALIGSTWGDQGGTTANGNWTPDAKGPQDPCPTGYRVPSQTEWVEVKANNTVSRTGPFDVNTSEFGSALHYGPNSSTKLLTLPAAGRRLSSTGGLNGRGSRGYYWSSTENGSSAYSLNFGSGYVSPDSIDDRTYGFSLRCIAE